ncbi:beta-galactosidase [Sulfitobacter donghicola]|uniref:Beta-galactosidase n=1 Tax=Sulfitobacter donghicola DSW-25 = KCTC 12864 = JCM 14565 TaxID=1300350 RepID=A0A073IGM3_9RHOB|nr:beta-galactosidase [Sulfitobacter donghicola]KEJ88949.1 beta-galactosidase [Sulfitobacter donghicola DSW-25 = KCTC 12864 = JCM 14565]KIN67505.1 Beta-galactosidase [Sulfitobacter donghicola DSW-25 = KCTC 12864 = JCM 14565]
MKRSLGTCYYPEQWSPEVWADDARRMVEAGLTWVRIGEFAWSKLEPQPDTLCWDWLDEAINVLGQAGLKVVLGTPTATPPRWMVTRHPDMLAVDVEGRPRKFGSRRHYCFSHEGYRAECRRIVGLIAQRYGQNTHVAAWQTDNEYGCHDTTISYSDAARRAFQLWLADRYETIDRLNNAWGNTFWSMEYGAFEEVDLPNLTVTEANPAHCLAFRRFSSDQVVSFNRLQVELIKAHSAAPVSHNYMGRITDFDHFAVGADLDIATWDSYPLGFLEDRVGADAQRQREYARQGDPDFQALHHDLYRAVGKGRWWVMEQQPGPVNWAPYNPIPLKGMVRLWSWEAFAHGAEAVCYFRWRQAPVAQEQMHAGLLRPDGADATVMKELSQVSSELANAPDVVPVKAPVAIVFDYDADFAWAVQPHGLGLDYFGLILDTYRALRSLGLSVDILPASTRDFDGYKLTLVPGMMHLPDGLKETLSQSEGDVVYGPRTGARGPEMNIPIPLPPAIPDLDILVAEVESLRVDVSVPVKGGGNVIRYREALEGSAKSVLETQAGQAVAVQTGRQTYLAAWLDAEALGNFLRGICKRADIATLDLPDGIRIRDTGSERFWFNYTDRQVACHGVSLPAAGVLRTSPAEP